MQFGINDTIPILFISFQRGEEKGYAYFFHAHYRSLFYYANSLLKNEILTEDIVADCFLKLYQKRLTIQSESTIKSFLYTTVRNACMDNLRKKKVQCRNEEGIVYLKDTIEASAAEHLIRTETLSLILAAIEQLPAASRTVFKLHYLEGKSYDEIAEELGRSKETIRKQKQYGLLFLRKKFSGLIALLFFLLH